MVLALQLTLDALAKWGVYALLACGFGLLYCAFRVFHVAFAGLIVIAPYTAVALAGRMPLVPAIVIGSAASAVVGLALERLFFRPLADRGAGTEGGMIASMGVYVVMQSLMTIVCGPGIQVFGQDQADRIVIGPLSLSTAQIDDMAAALAVGSAFLVLTLARPVVLAQIKALGEQPRLLAFHGVEIVRLRMIVWAAAAGLGGLAGALHARDVGVDPRAGLPLFLGAAVAVFLGGRNRPLGWVLGAFCVAWLETIVSLWFDSKWAATFLYSCTLLALHARPHGLAAAASREIQS